MAQLIQKYSQVIYDFDKNMIYWEENKTTTELNNDVGEILGKSLYVKVHDENIIDIISKDLECDLELNKIYQHYGCSCDIMIISEKDQLSTKDNHSDLMYEGGLYTYEKANGKNCVCIYLKEES